MAEIQNVTGTAFIVAEMRASENAEANPLYRDPIVPLFLSDETRTAAERFSAVFPRIKKVIKLRTRYFDRQLHLGCRQWLYSAFFRYCVPHGKCGPIWRF